MPTVPRVYLCVPPKAAFFFFKPVTLWLQKQEMPSSPLAALGASFTLRSWTLQTYQKKWVGREREEKRKEERERERGRLEGMEGGRERKRKREKLYCVKCFLDNLF